jgi:DNA-3-methyladenine glycosylase
MTRDVLGRSFYMLEPLAVARNLIGKRLVSYAHGIRVAGMIYETEAYDGEQDLACHARTGKTSRNAIMYEEGGHAYVYFTYGMHWMFNCVTGAAGCPAAVLVRAIIPTEGIETIRMIREPIPQRHWCDGPGKLTRALGINGKHNGADLCSIESLITIENGDDIADVKVRMTPRIGIDRAPEPWKSKPWRFIADIR